ncbi:hypothetical protein Clacol_001141 [Clathrus columnatus]|uniref:Peptidase A1 domain-containing protein n=1 Tax=Clathrus columnatus TaxID=1419009 RepID=A0AAV4ZYJ7_9AGAM|nr:hypothetical protein Clacol_001141 [Clathrus columnatus]
MTDFDTIKRKIIKRHLAQLEPHELVAGPLESLPLFSTYDDLVTWTNDSQTQINTGKSNRVYGGTIGSPINFNNAFMAFMESAAVYLRDVSTVIRAVGLYRTNNDDDEAIRLMENSTKQISDLRHPDGHSTMVGPFCGAFFPKDYKTSSNPYLGIAFKGTNLTSREILNDLWAALTVRADGYVWNSQVAQGFYYPLISTYYKTASLVPYTMVRTAISDIVNGSANNVIMHVTGHSLGGAYGALTYGQLTISGSGATKAVLGDLYTFGAPRVGRADFAVPFKAAVAAGTTCIGSPWRIMNFKDIVPKVPASPPWPVSRDPYIHIDSAYIIYPDENPVLQPSEIGTHPTWPAPVISVKPHYTTEYYKSMTYATTHRSPAHLVTAWGTLPLPKTTLSSSEVENKPFWNHQTTANSFTLENRGGYVVGWIQYGSLIGQITALGNVQASLISTKIFNFDTTEGLFTRENQCVFVKEAKAQLGLYFVVAGTVVGYASVVTRDNQAHGVSDGTLTRGQCIWEWFFAAISALPTISQQGQRRSRNSLVKREDSIPQGTSVSLSYQLDLGEFLATVQVGNPPTNFSLLVDTGLDVCDKHVNRGSAVTLVGFASTFVSSNTTNFTGELFDEPFITGEVLGVGDCYHTSPVRYIAIDTVTLAPGLVIQNQTFGIAALVTLETLTVLDGVLGLSPIGSSQGVFHPNGELVKTVMNNAKEQGLIEQEIIGLDLNFPLSLSPGDLQDVGLLTYGGIDSTQFCGDLLFVERFSTNELDNVSWAIDSPNLFLGNTSLITNLGYVIDSGETQLLLPETAFEKYVEITGATVDGNGFLHFTPDQVQNIPDLIFDFGNV